MTKLFDSMRRWFTEGESIRQTGERMDREINEALAHAVLDVAYSRHHNTLPGGLCDPTLCRATAHQKAR